MVNKVIMVLYIYVLSFKSVALQEPTHVKTKFWISRHYATTCEICNFNNFRRNSARKLMFGKQCYYRTLHVCFKFQVCSSSGTYPGRNQNFEFPAKNFEFQFCQIWPSKGLLWSHEHPICSNIRTKTSKSVFEREIWVFRL